MAMAPRRVGLQSLCILVLVAVLLFLIGHHLISPFSDPDQAAARIAQKNVVGGGVVYRWPTWRNERTVAVETLGETKFARCDVHTVLSEDGTTVIRDWLVLEEAPAVNVIVQTLEGNRFVVFQQKKYAIPGETMSPLGGFIDLGESPLVAAKREVLEELGLGSRQTMQLVQIQSKSLESLSVLEIAKIITDNAMPEAVDELGLLIDQSSSKVTTTQVDSDSDWIFLGRYRTAANRGGGFLYSYLLKNAVPLLHGGGTSNYVGGTGDFESQTIMHLTEAEVMDALADGKFQEVKWAASFALAMLHLKDGMSNPAIRTHGK